MRIVEFEYSGSVNMGERELWPDGDAPENWTLQDVVKLIVKDGGKFRILRDWNLTDALELNIRDQSDGLIGDWMEVPR